MSKNAQAASLAVMPGSVTGDLLTNPLTDVANAFYEKHWGLGRGIVPIRCYVDKVRLGLVARALRRQITRDELMLFVGLESGTATCTITGEQFRPVWWRIITSKFLDTVKRDRQVTQVNVKQNTPRCGSFFLHPDPSSDQILVVSGYPFSWGDRARDVLAEKQPMVVAYRKNRERWGVARDTIDRKLAERQARRAQKVATEVREFETMGRELAEYFGIGK